MDKGYVVSILVWCLAGCQGCSWGLGRSNVSTESSSHVLSGLLFDDQSNNPRSSRLAVDGWLRMGIWTSPLAIRSYSSWWILIFTWPSWPYGPSPFRSCFPRNGVLKSTWIPGLFNPMAFLTAVMQVTARSKELPLDFMTNRTTFLSHGQGGWPSQGTWTFAKEQIGISMGCYGSSLCTAHIKT